MSQIIFKISVLFTFCLLIIVVKKAEIVLTLINDTGKVLNSDFQIVIYQTMEYGERISCEKLKWTHFDPRERKRNQEATEVSEELSF